MATYRKILQQLSTRHGQKKSPYFLVEGVRCCEEALKRRSEWLVQLVVAESFDAAATAARFDAALLASAEVVSDREFAGLSVTENPQGILAIMAKPNGAELPTSLPSPCCLILDRVQEPGNVGTILRTAWAAGMNQVWLVSGSADVYSPKVVRSGMGAQFAVDTFYFPTLQAAVDHFRKLGGSRVWCTLPQAGIDMFSQEFAPRNAAIILGNEANGIADASVGEAVTIAMPGHAESLNVAQAATLFIFEALRR